eukprot:5735327-Prymnesium_polylepis.1
MSVVETLSDLTAGCLRIFATLGIGVEDRRDHQGSGEIGNRRSDLRRIKEQEVTVRGSCPPSRGSRACPPDVPQARVAHQV